MHTQQIGPALPESGVVIDYKCHGNAAPPRGLELCQMIVKRAVATEAHYFPMWRSTLGAKRGRKRPSERAGCPQVRLGGMGEGHHCGRPNGGVAGVGDQNSVGGQGLG